MPEYEVTLPDRIESDLEHLVDSGEFLNRERAVEELLSLGLSAYETTDEPAGEPGENPFSHVADEQQDPAARDGPGTDPHRF